MEIPLNSDGFERLFQVSFDRIIVNIDKKIYKEPYVVNPLNELLEFYFPHFTIPRNTRRHFCVCQKTVLERIRSYCFIP